MIHEHKWRCWSVVGSSGFKSLHKYVKKRKMYCLSWTDAAGLKETWVGEVFRKKEALFSAHTCAMNVDAH